MLPMLRTRNFLPGFADDFFGKDFLPGFFSTESESMPAVNIIEGKNEFKVEVAAPGLDKDDFRINLEENILSITSEKETKKEEGDEKVMRKEFSYSSFKRSFILPDSIDADKISARHKYGILQISIPKKEEAKKKVHKQISIS